VEPGRESGVGPGGLILPGLTARDILETLGFRGFKVSRKPALWLEAAPQQVEPCLLQASGHSQQIPSVQKKSLRQRVVGRFNSV